MGKSVPAADFSLPDLAGRTIKLSDFKGKVVFLNFFATWCPPCRAEMPSIQALFKKIRALPTGQGNKFEILTISIDQTGAAAVKAFVEKGGYTFKVLLDPGGRVASQYGVVNIPATFIINTKGWIVDRIIGSTDWAEFSLNDK